MGSNPILSAIFSFTINCFIDEIANKYGFIVRMIKAKSFELIMNLLEILCVMAKKFFGLIVVLISLVCGVAILSYNQLDESFNVANSNEPINIFSCIGSYSSDLLIQWFGILGSFILLISLFKFGNGLMNNKVRCHKIIMGILSAVLSSFCIYKCMRKIFYSGATGYMLYFNLDKYLNNIPYKNLTLNVIFSIAFFITVLLLLHILDFSLSRFKKIFAKKKKDIVVSDEFKPIVNIQTENKDEFIKSLQPVPAKKTNHKKAEQNVKPSINLSEFTLPPIGLLKKDDQAKQNLSNDDLEKSAENLLSVLGDFGINGEINSVNPGPVVTLYELKPAAGIKSARVIGLASDIARYMSAVSARVSVVPGKNALGIELPNKKRQIVYLRTILESDNYKNSNHALPIVLGKSISGAPIVADLAKMPHLLIAGTTGSGKSVGINAMILSLLYKLPPSKCRFIMVDPKMLELSVYDDIPHLLIPVVTEPKKAVTALKWAVKEMENRYIAMAKLGVRNIEGYNAKITEMISKGEVPSRKVQTGFDPETGLPIYEEQTLHSEELPYIVIVVDEMADLMLVAGKDIEVTVQRLAQMARAAGIHLIMATQRPSVDVITGTIKANFPTRISFQVSSKIDSRTILGEQGAEQLLGQGDMLYMATGGRLLRVHGPFVSDSEVEKIVNYLKEQESPKYIEEILSEDGDSDLGGTSDSGEADPMYKEAVELIMREGKVSTSFLQRHLQIGYNRAARIVDIMEKNGVVSAANHVGKREILK